MSNSNKKIIVISNCQTGGVASVLQIITRTKVIGIGITDFINKYEDIFYFPSFEVITANANCGNYFSDDFRQVNKVGVSKVMSLFRKHFMGNQENEYSGIETSEEIQNSELVCDEELVADIIKRSGLKSE